MKKISKKQKKEINGGSTKGFLQAQAFGYPSTGNEQPAHILSGTFRTGGGNLRVGSVSRN